LAQRKKSQTGNKREKRKKKRKGDVKLTKHELKEIKKKVAISMGNLPGKKRFAPSDRSGDQQPNLKMRRINSGRN